MALYCYRVGHRKDIQSFENNGFDRQYAGSNEGLLYGNGVYANIDLNQSKKAVTSPAFNYGDTIIKSEIKGGLNNLFIFDGSLARKAFGTTDLKTQVYQLLSNKEDANYVWGLFKDTMESEHLGYNETMGTYRTVAILRRIFYEMGRAHHKKITDIFLRNRVKGCIYHGVRDGFSIVVYDYGAVVPVAYSTDAGDTWEKLNAKEDRVDAFNIIGQLYQKVLNTTYTDEGAFCMVLKNNGKYNQINLKVASDIIGQSNNVKDVDITPAEISPIDFDSATIMDKNGNFQLEYNGNFYKANISGFEVDDQLYAFEMLPYAEDLKGLYENNLSFMLAESLLSHAGLNDANYMNYEIPDNKNIGNSISLYKVVKGSAVDSLLKTGEHDQFVASNGGDVYGRCIYSWLNLSSAQKYFGVWGNSIIQYKLLGGFDKFISFVPEVTTRIYGRNLNFKAQLRTFLSEREVNEILKEIRDDDESSYNMKRFSKIAPRYKIRGVIVHYHGSRDIAVFPYDFSSIVPYAVSTDAGKTWKTRYDKHIQDRAETYVDANWRLANKGYKKISNSVTCKFNGGQGTYAIVQKPNGKYNIVDCHTEEEMSSVDFDSATLPNAQGKMQVEYNGNFYNALPIGFYFDMGDGDAELCDFGTLLYF